MRVLPRPPMLSALPCPALEVPTFCLLSSPEKAAWGQDGRWKPLGPEEQGQLPVVIIRGGEMQAEAPLVWK